MKLTNVSVDRVIAALGGVTAAAKATGLGRTVLQYWKKHGAPSYRRGDVARLHAAVPRSQPPENTGEKAA